MATLPSPSAAHSANSYSSILQPPALLIRAPTFRAADAAPLAPARPSTPPSGFPAPGSQLQPSPTPSNASRYSVELPTYDDYEHIPQLPSPPRALSPCGRSRGHERSASVPHNEFLDPAFADLTYPAGGRSRAHSHQRSRTELLPAFVSQTLRRTLSRSPARSGKSSVNQSPERRHQSRSASPEKLIERPESVLSLRGGGKEDGMPLTGDGRVSAAARRRAAAEGSEVDLGSVMPASPEGPAIKGLGSWISEAAAQVSATVSQVASGSRPALERQRSDSVAPSIGSITSGLQQCESLKSNTGTPGTPLIASSLRPALPNSTTPSFGGAAKATLTSLFSSKPAPPPTSNPLDDELCTLDLLAALPVPNEGTSAADLHKTAMSLLKRYQNQYRTRLQQVQALKQEAEVRDEELEGHNVRSRSLKAQLEAMARTVQERDDVFREREQTLRELREELREKNAFIDEVAGLEPQTPLEELDVEEVEGRRESRATEDTESVFSGKATANDTPNTHTTNTSSASSIRAVPTLRPDLREGLATSSLLSPLSSSGADKRPQAPSSSGKTTMPYKCENCQGSSSSHAWVALSRIRTENQGLKDDNRQLQDCIDDALGVVNAAKRGRGVMSG